MDGCDQVGVMHGLLLLAAERTAQVLREPAPFVLQSALDDFYVKYELNVYAASYCAG
jgi:small-conductance mechanosensitive channel